MFWTIADDDGFLEEGKRIPFIRQLKGYDQYYIRQGIRTYRKRVERIVRMLQRQGYEFVTFSQLMQIMNAET